MLMLILIHIFSLLLRNQQKFWKLSEDHDSARVLWHPCVRILLGCPRVPFKQGRGFLYSTFGRSRCFPGANPLHPPPSFHQ